MSLSSAFPIVNDLVNEVPAPKYGSRTLNNGRYTEDGLSRAKHHANSASVKQMAPITYLIRGNVQNLLRFGKETALDQLFQGHYSQPQVIDAHWKPLSAFPPDKDMTLIHAGETGVVISSYTHTVYPVTRLAHYSKIKLPNNQYQPMNNILTLPEDTVSFNAKLRFIHKSKDGTVKYPGDIRKMALRSDLKISAWVPIDPSRPMNEGNRRLQVLLPVEYKRHNTFSKADMDSSTLSPYDERIPAVVKNHVGYDCILGSSPRQPPPPQQNVQPPR